MLNECISEREVGVRITRPARLIWRNVGPALDHVTATRVLIASRARKTPLPPTTTIYKLSTNIKSTWSPYELLRLRRHLTLTVSTPILFQLVSSPEVLAGSPVKPTKTRLALISFHLSGVLGAFSQLQREHKKHAIHPAALRAQGKYSSRVIAIYTLTAD